MPKHEDGEPTVAGCHGCAIETAVNADGYCPRCAANRKHDPTVVVEGRTLTVSELRMQAEDDKSLAAALDGDTVREQIEAARGDR